MLLLGRALLGPLLLLPPPCTRQLAMCAEGEAAAAGGDALLMAAMAALKERDGNEAQKQLLAAREAYNAVGGPSEEQQQLLNLVSQRVDAAVMPGFGRAEAKRPPPPTKKELEERAEAKARGERALMNTLETFGNKEDGERFGKALAYLEEARAAFRRAGSDVERERDGVVGNLYAVIRAEEERSQRVAKLVRMKRLLELTKQKRKAETLGIDGDDFEAMIEQGGSEPAAEAPSENTADDILSAWRAEGLDAEGQKLDALERQVQDLEDSLGDGP